MKPGKQKLPKAQSKPVLLEEVFVPMATEQNNERIQRLARKILRIVENNRKRGDSKPKHGSELFDSTLEEIVGL